MPDKEEKKEDQTAEEAEAKAAAEQAESAEPEAALPAADSESELEAAGAEAEEAEPVVAAEPESQPETQEETVAETEAELEEAETPVEAKPKKAAKAKPRKAKAKKKVREKAPVAVPAVKELAASDAGLSPKVFEVEPNTGVMHEVVRAELAALRRGTASAKNRSEVRGGGKKPWRQKGTGRARAGSSRMPHWTGGGITFGPTPRSYTFKVNRKMRGKALRMALTARAGEGNFRIVDSLDFDEPKTAAAAAVLDNLDVHYPLLVLLAGADNNAELAFRNIPGVGVTDMADLLVADVLQARTVLVTKAALDELNTLGEAK